MPARPTPPAEAPGVPPGTVPSEAVPAFKSIRAWLAGCLATRRPSQRLLTRLAVLVLGLVAGPDGSVNGLGRTLKGLHPAGPRGVKRASCSRRVKRMLDDSQFDPQTLLRDVLRPLLPAVLAEVLATHEQRAQRAPGRHRRTPLLRVVVDESNHQDHGHLLTAGLAYRGIVLPLALRVWAQNVALPEGEYWAYVQSVLQEVYEVLPPALRDHVLVLADRAYGVPRLLDLLTALGWDWVLRVQGQVRVRRRDGGVLPLGALAPRPGSTWCGGFDPPAAALPPDAAPAPVEVFKAAGWRRSQVVAVWVPGEDEPWLLLTSLAPTAARLRDYAQRWAVERLFLSWKSHGWNLEASGVTDPARLGRLLTGYVLATHWRLAAGVLEADLALAAAAQQAQRRCPRGGHVRQLPLPLWPGPAPRHGDPRPDAAKHSLFSLGTAACLETPCRFYTPPLRWRFPDWDAPPWGAQLTAVHTGSTRGTS